MALEIKRTILKPLFVSLNFLTVKGFLLLVSFLLDFMLLGLGHLDCLLALLLLLHFGMLLQ